MGLRAVGDIEAGVEGPGGSSGQLQYNNGGAAFGGIALWSTDGSGTLVGATGSSFSANGPVKSISSSSGIGYGTGAGGVVTQLTDKSTAVSINTVSGQITMNNASFSAASSISFTMNNTSIDATDTISVSIAGGESSPGQYCIWVSSVASHSCLIVLRNFGSTATDAIVINYNVIKGVAA